MIDILGDLKIYDEDLYNKFLIYIHNNTKDGELLLDNNHLLKILQSLSKEDNLDLWDDLVAFLKVKKIYSQNFPLICTMDIKRYDVVESILKTIVENNIISIEEEYSLYWQLVYLNFSTSFISTDDLLLNMYKSIFNKVKKSSNLNFISDDTSIKKRVFIYINSYPSKKNAVVKILHIWAEQFAKLGYKVIVIVTTPIPYPYPFYTSDNYFFKKIGKKGEVGTLGDNITAIEIGGDIDFDNKNNIYNQFLSQVNINNNDKFLLLGHSCLHFDLLPFDNKFLIPTSMPEKIVCTNANRYILNKKMNLSNIDGKSMDHLDSPSDFTNDNNIEFKPTQILNEKDINIVIVGNRLDDELDYNLWKNIKKITDNIPSLRIHIIGKYKRNIPKSLIDKTILNGWIDNLEDYLKTMHFYLNPDRIGGGQSALTAVKCGIPIITLPKGDVYNMIEQKYHIENLSEIDTFINNYINDKNFKETIDTYNKEFAEKHNNSSIVLEDTAKKILGIDL
ncbi:MAG: glycosyltransferase [Campylobacterota bacterium]|nr:glycosyltransferase [Campylobacterota bacterium]